jgi:hypothetical protein
MGTDKKKVQGAIINEMELEEVNQEGCLMGLLKSLIEEQRILPKADPEKRSVEEVMEQRS